MKGRLSPPISAWKRAHRRQSYALFQRLRLATNIPCEHLIILANTDTYGGGGIYNSYTLTTAHHPSFRPVVVHEFGHSFGGLGDEYFYEGNLDNDEMHSLEHEPWEPNITTLVDFDSKWADMVEPGIEIPTAVTEERSKNYTVGVYEGAWSQPGTEDGSQEALQLIREERYRPQRGRPGSHA